MKNKRNIFIILFFLSFAKLFSESIEQPESNKFSNCLITYSEITFINISIANFNNLFTGYEWTYFNPEIIKQTFSLPPVWDWSSFTRNQIFHPYFGASYFNSARTNNLDFFESFIATVFGSFMWEGLIERGNFSLNDLITTSYTGSITGEALFRLSNYVYKFSPVLAISINPMCGINYLVNKDFVSEIKPDFFNSKYFTDVRYNFYKKTADFGLGMSFIYNNNYNHQTYKIFDQFNFSISANIGKEGYSYKYFLDGLLYSFSPNDNFSFGLSSFYNAQKDFDINSSNSDIGLFCKYFICDKNDFKYLLNTHLCYTILGTQDSCEYGQGPLVRLNILLDFNKITFNADYFAQYLFAYSGTDNFTQKLITSLNINLNRNFYLAFDDELIAGEKLINTFGINFGLNFTKN